MIPLLFHQPKKFSINVLSKQIPFRAIFDSKDKGKINERLSAAKEDKNEKYRQYIKPEMGQYKAVVGVLTPFLNMSIGMPVLVIGIVRFIFQLGAILMLVAIPFLLVLSFFPALDYLIFKGFRTFVGFMLQKSIYSILILVAFLIFNIVDTLIPMGSIVAFMVNLFIKGLIGLIAFFKRKEILQKLGLRHADATLHSVKKSAQQAKQETKERVRSGIDRGQRGILKGAEIAGKMNGGFGGAVSAMQALNRSMQQRKNRVSEPANGRVINPLELGTRNKQQLPFSGKKVIYGEHTKGQPSHLKKDGVGGLPFNPLKDRSAQSKTQNQPFNTPRLMTLTRNPINYAGQKIPLINRTIPQIKLNPSVRPPRESKRRLNESNVRFTRTPIERTGQKIPLTNPYLPHLVLDKKFTTSLNQNKKVRNHYRKEKQPIGEKVIKKNQIRSLPSGRTSQRKVGSFYGK